MTKYLLVISHLVNNGVGWEFPPDGLIPDEKFGCETKAEVEAILQNYRKKGIRAYVYDAHSEYGDEAGFISFGKVDWT